MTAEIEGSRGLPSGYVNSGEILEDALRREVAGENRYQVGDLTPIRLVSGYKLRLEASYFGHLVGGEQRLDRHEVLAARFFPLRELLGGLIDSHRQRITRSQPATDEQHW